MNSSSSYSDSPFEGDPTKRTLQFFWIADYSSSMSGKKIATLNQAIREAVPAVKQAASGNAAVSVEMRAIKFSSSASWHIGPTKTPLEQFVWPELSANGGTSTAQAIKLLSDELAVDKMGTRGCPPVCILISDGFCTDPPSEYEDAIRDLEASPWGSKAIRLAIAIGEESDYDEAQLLRFVSHKEIGVLKAKTVDQLVGYIIWASTAATMGATSGATNAQGITGSNSAAPNVQLPTNPTINPTGLVF